MTKFFRMLVFYRSLSAQTVHVYPLSITFLVLHYRQFTDGVYVGESQPRRYCGSRCQWRCLQEVSNCYVLVNVGESQPGIYIMVAVVNDDTSRKWVTVMSNLSFHEICLVWSNLIHHILVDVASLFFCDIFIPLDLMIRVFVLSVCLSDCHFNCLYNFLSPAFCKSRGHLNSFVHLSVCLSVCRKNLNLAHIFWSINDRALIFGMHDHCD